MTALHATPWSARGVGRAPTDDFALNFPRTQQSAAHPDGDTQIEEATADGDTQQETQPAEPSTQQMATDPMVLSEPTTSTASPSRSRLRENDVETEPTTTRCRIEIRTGTVRELELETIPEDHDEPDRTRVLIAAINSTTLSPVAKVCTKKGH